MQRTILVFILCTLFITRSSAGTADSLVDEGWRAWRGTHGAAAAALFERAIAADPGATRAYAGLALVHALYDRHLASWQAFRHVLTTEPDYFPWLFATWVTSEFKPLMENDESGIVPLLKEIAGHGDPQGIVRAQACEVLGEYYRDRGDLTTSDEWYGRMNAIAAWTVIGPFDNISASGFDRVFPPEHEYRRDMTYEGKNGVPASWFTISTVRPDYWIDHTRYFAYTNAVFYANVFVHSPTDRPAQIRIGTSGSLKAFLNDAPLIEYFDENNNDLDTYVIATQLRQGWNRLLIKCGYSEITRCNFMVRITDPSGNALDGLTVSTEPQVYTPATDVPHTIVPNFAEEFFRRRIAEHPDHIENYVLLAQCYARNDKAVEAELALRDAITRAPECPLLYNSILEAYVRGEKYDEISRTIEKASGIDPDLPAVLTYKFTNDVKNEDFDHALGLLKRMEARDPESESVYLSYVSLYGARKQVDKVIEYNTRGFAKHPTNWQLAYLQALISIQTTQKYSGAIDILKEFLSREYTANALYTLADCYLRSSDIPGWKRTFDKLLAFEPMAPGYHLKMAETWISLQRYDDAEQSLNLALGICPNSSVFWSKLGDVYRAKKDPDRARDAFDKALRYNPTDYDARETLRELEGKPDVFTVFPAVPVDSLIRTAPAASSMPDAKGIILLDDLRRVVFDRGISMSSGEYLVKLFNKSGIDDFKEYSIPYNPNTEGLIVDKAVVMKKDGTEIKADVNRNHIVFKSMEENDCLYIRWKIKNYYNGKLSNHFWEHQKFQWLLPGGDCPVLASRPGFSLLQAQDTGHARHAGHPEDGRWHALHLDEAA